MKIVDQTPFFTENGELSLIDRLRATLEFGPGWVKEIEAQKSVISILKKSLDKNFTMLCNVIPPGLDARIPLILVGPTGLYVMVVTPKAGMFRAKGDQWGIISGNSIKAENPNLLTRTERMARAIQIYLQRQGYIDLFNVEAVLLCSDTATNVDSMRPIIRVIMRDMLERFAASIPQSRVVLSPESVFDIVNRLLNPPPPPPSKSAVAAPPAPAVVAPPAPAVAAPPAHPEAAGVAPVQSASPFVSTFTLPSSSPFVSSETESIQPAPVSSAEAPAASPTSILASTAKSVPKAPDAIPENSPSPAAPALPRFGLARNQIALLIGMAVIWILILAVFAFLIAITINPPLILLK